MKLKEELVGPSSQDISRAVENQAGIVRNGNIKLRIKKIFHTDRKIDPRRKGRRIDPDRKIDPDPGIKIEYDL